MPIPVRHLLDIRSIVLLCPTFPSRSPEKTHLDRYARTERDSNTAFPALHFSTLLNYGSDTDRTGIPLVLVDIPGSARVIFTQQTQLFFDFRDDERSSGVDQPVQ